MRDLFESLDDEANEKKVPLAERMRPRSLAEVIGQPHLVGPGMPLSQLEGDPPSMILWGPPGTGKTTIARLVAGKREFRQISAVLSGVKELRDLVEARGRRGFVLFVDEIHRWNKAQQDALLPHVESGLVTLIGATTENPSFSLIAPLLSRAKLFVLRPLGASDLRLLLERALFDREQGLGRAEVSIEEDALAALVEISSGDARRALGNLEILASLAKHIDAALVEKLFERRTLRYDKAGEQHYDLISAFIKSMRGSDPNAAVYYFARMYEAGEDPRFLARRMMIFAAEDVGNADPRALEIATTAAAAFDRIGDAEGWIPLAQAVVYLATAPKSNASYAAYKAAKEVIEKTGDLEVPLALRNAPTKLMRALDYGAGYEYAHDDPDGIVNHEHLPQEIVGKVFYRPTERGYEKSIGERLTLLRAKRAQKNTQA